ncbi:hypothetical protein [Haemophilus parahaemolyticus]|uniref:hypothetical protein n=1 Tax=Haemophilus parahaemolyticus TaxID=735 RepID=UPI0028F0BA2E|nr:hypothetical protein [Haemophilus parahaemolyticus]
MTKQTTQMQTPYELFAYQVGQDMNTLENRVMVLESKSTPTMPKVDVPKTQLMAVFTATIQPALRAQDEHKVNSGEYEQDESHILGTIQVSAKYAGYQFLMLDQASSNRPMAGVVGENGMMGFYSQTTHARNVVVFLYQPEQAETSVYFDVKEVPKIKGVILAHVNEVFVEQGADGRISYVKLKGTNAKGQPEERYLEYGRDKLKVTAFEENTDGQTSEFVTIDTNAGIAYSEATDFMAEVDEADPNRITNPPRGRGFGIDEKKIRLEITTKEGFELSKEVENFKWAEQHQ